MLQRGGSSSAEEKLSSVFKPSTCMFPVRTLEVGKAAAGAGRKPLLQSSVPNCWGEAVRGDGRKDREVAAVRRGQVGEASKKRLEGCT